MYVMGGIRPAWKLGRKGTAELQYRAPMAPVAAAPPLGEAYVRAVRDAGMRLVDLDCGQGGDHIVDAAVRLFRSAYRRARTAPGTPALRRELLSATAEAGEIAGWVAYDADRPGPSRRLSHAALRTARLVGDTGMERFTLTNLAMLDLHLHRPGEVFRIAEHALDGELPRRVRTLFELRLARAHGQFGERPRALDTIARVRARYADGPSRLDPAWAWWLDPGEIRWHEAMLHAELGDWKKAAELFTMTGEERRYPAGQARAPFIDRSHLLGALVALGAWGEAERVLVRGVLPLLPDTASSRTSNLLRRLLPRLTAAPAPTPVRDAGEELRRALDADHAPPPSRGDAGFRSGHITANM